MRPLRALALLPCAVLTLLTAPPSASVTAAAQPAQPAPPAAVTWGVAPAGPQGPDGRGAYEWTLDPGAVLNDVVAVSNFGDAPLLLDVYAGDAINTADGGFDLLPAAEEPTDVGAWITVGGGADAGPLTVPPRSRLDVPFRVEVPVDATPGDHVGGVVAALSTTAGAGAGQVRVDRRVGARVYLRVTGELAPALTVQDLTVEHHGVWNPFGAGSVTAAFTVADTGNTRLSAAPAVDVAPLVGGTRAAGEPLPELLPGADLRTAVRVDGVRPWLRLRVTATAATDGAPTAVATATVWVVPWPLVWLLIGALAVVVAIRLIRRARAGADARADARARARLTAQDGVTAAPDGVAQQRRTPAGNVGADTRSAGGRRTPTEGAR